MSTIDLTHSMTHMLAWFGLPGGPEWIILLILGLLLFGRRLPEVGRSLGRGIVEFKKGIRGIEDEVDEEASSPKSSRRLDNAPRQELPKARPADEAASSYATVEERRQGE